MIERYQTSELSKILSEEYKYSVWIDVERAVAEIQEAEGIIPRGLSRRLRHVRVTPKRIEQIERRTNHDVIAFLEAVREKMKREGRWLHFGMTSYDLVDTAFVLIMIRATDIILRDIRKLDAQLLRLKKEYADTPQMGRTHGVFAQPITFGYKAASWHEEVVRNHLRIRDAERGIAFGKLSGAVGTYTILPPIIEKKVMRKLGLEPEPVSTQVLPRDRFAALASAYTLYACGLDRIATEIRNLSRSEIGELSEPFTRGQKGSSAMPHKKNPITCERVCGLAKVVRGYMVTIYENINLWHERDLTNSSAERVVFPDMLHLIHYMTLKMQWVLENLQVFPDRMRENIEKSHGVYASQRLMNALIERGMDRTQAYALVQRLSFNTARTGNDLKTEALASDEVTEFLGARELETVFTIDAFLKHVRPGRKRRRKIID